MNSLERTAVRALLASVKGARDALSQIPPGTPPGESRINRELLRAERAIGAGEALLDRASTAFDGDGTRL